MKNKTIAEIVKTTRRKSMMTQVQFAKAMQTKQNNISRIENGLRNLPKNKIKLLSELSKLSEKTIYRAWIEHFEKYGSETL